MHSPTMTLTALAAFAGAILLVADAPRFAPAEGATLTRTIDTSMLLTSESIKIVMDGEEIESGMGSGLVLEDTSHTVVEDEYVKIGKGRPLVLKRTYAELSGDSKQKYKAEGDEHEVTKEQESGLAKKTVVFKWDEEDEKYNAAFDDEEGDEELLENLEEDMDFRAFLPESGVKEGATWTVTGSAARAFVFPGGDLKLEDTEKDPEDEDRSELDRELSENLKGKIEATFKGLREEDGKKLGVIELKGEVESKSDMESKMEGEIELTLASEITGEILWDMTANHVHAVTVTGDEKVSYVSSLTIEDGGSHTIQQKFEMTGKSKFEMKVAK